MQPIANRQSDIKIKTNSQLVDILLMDCENLIEPEYQKWFARKFYDLDESTVRQLASEAKADGKNPKRLFCYLINKAAQRRQPTGG